MKIAIDCRMISMSGIGVYLDNILCHWVECGDGHQFLLLGDSKQLGKYSKHSSCLIEECSISIFSRKEFTSFPVDVINECDCFYTPNFNIPRGIKVPIFSTIHDVVSLDVDNNTSFIGKLLRKLFMRRALKLSSFVFTVSEFSKARISFHFPRYASKLRVGYNGVSHSIRQNLAIVPKVNKSSYFLYVGNIKQHKGLDVLISAFELYQKSNSDVELYIIGNADNFRTSDASFSARIAANSAIYFTGRVDNSVLYQYLVGARALIQPSRYEGFGIPPLEALYLGTSVIISDIDVFKEIYFLLPVTFFENNNSNDLCVKMSEIDLSRKIDCRNLIDQTYNYKKTAAMILNTIKIVK